MEKAAPQRFPAAVIASLFLSLALTACGGGGGGGDGSGPLPGDRPPETPAFTGLPMFAEAVMVFGQPGFTTNEPNGGDIAPTGATLREPVGVVVSADGQLFISDSMNRRVLGLHSVPDRFGQSADFVLGQQTPSEGGDTGELDGYVQPQAVAVGAGVVAVADRLAHRVLIYHGIPTDGTARPTVVVGQQNFEGREQTCNGVTLSSPRGVHITTDGKLIVADSDHSRVLIWKSIPGPGDHGRAPDVILGQPSPTSCSANAGGGLLPGRNTMHHPMGVWSDGTRLAVADTDNNRILLWDELTMVSGQEPDRVLGQATFDSAALDVIAADRMSGPRGVASNGTHFAVSDTSNNRVLLWNQWPSGNGQAANAVIGQRDFFGGTRNDADGDRFADDAPSAQTMDTPIGIAFHQDKLLVIEEGNSRLLIFQSSD